MEDKLLDKLDNEMKKYKEFVKENGVDYAIDRAYEITAKQEIIDSLEYDITLSNAEIKALLSRENLLEELYNDWISFDGNMREDIGYSIEKSVRIISEDYKKEHKKEKSQER